MGFSLRICEWEELENEKNRVSTKILKKIIFEEHQVRKFSEIQNENNVENLSLEERANLSEKIKAAKILLHSGILDERITKKEGDSVIFGEPKFLTYFNKLDEKNQEKFLTKIEKLNILFIWKMTEKTEIITQQEANLSLEKMRQNLKKIME